MSDIDRGSDKDPEGINVDDKQYHFKVDTKPHTWPSESIGYEDVTKLSRGKEWTELSLFTVDYVDSAGRPTDGELKPKGTVKLKKEGTSFDVTYLGEA